MSVGAPPAAEVVPPAAQAAQGARPADRNTWPADAPSAASPKLGLPALPNLDSPLSQIRTPRGCAGLGAGRQEAAANRGGCFRRGAEGEQEIGHSAAGSGFVERFVKRKCR